MYIIDNYSHEYKTRRILDFDKILLYLKNTDQMKYGSFIKKMAEDFTTGWENVNPIHIEDVQHVLSIHKYNQAYHDKHKKQ